MQDKKTKKKRKLTRVSEVLESRFIKKKLSTLILEYKLRENWPSIIGKTLCEKTEPYRIFRKVLTIKVESSVISNQLIYLKEELKDRISELLGKGIVEDFNFQVRKLNKEYLRDIKKFLK